MIMFSLYSLGGGRLTAHVDRTLSWPKAIPHLHTLPIALQAKQPLLHLPTHLTLQSLPIFLQDWSGRINFALGLTPMNIKAHSWKHLFRFFSVVDFLLPSAVAIIEFPTSVM